MIKNLFLCCMVALISLPGTIFAMDHNMSGMDHSMDGMEHNMSGMDHNSMRQNIVGSGYDLMEPKGDMHKKMLMIGEQTVDGVKATVYLKNVKETMTKMGRRETHHLMIHFFNDKNGETVTNGEAAVKIQGPDDMKGPAIKLAGMEGHFGVDVVIEQKGPYIFTIGTKLTDGVMRQFELKCEVK